MDFKTMNKKVSNSLYLPLFAWIHAETSSEKNNENLSDYMLNLIKKDMEENNVETPEKDVATPPPKGWFPTE